MLHVADTAEVSSNYIIGWTAYLYYAMVLTEQTVSRCDLFENSITLKLLFLLTST